ncbi:MAG: transposase [Prochloraceae cyanobacterium]|nr:transposase [Prochloraceae cyanobacterium]
MLLNYQYRAYPETAQKLKLNNWLRICRYWYNYQIGDRFDWWQFNRSSINACPLTCSIRGLKNRPDYYSQKKQLPILKKNLLKVSHSGELLDFADVPSQTLQDVSKRAALAFQRFIRGDKNGKRSGKPRFKNTARYRTMKFESNAIAIKQVTKKWLFLSVSKLDRLLRVRLHRPLPNGFKLKNAMISKKADGWYVTLCLEDKTVPHFIPDEIEPTWDNSIGMDAVLHENDYLATSDGIKLPSLKSFRFSENKLAKVANRKSSKKKGSKARRKLAHSEAKIHQRIARSRRDHAFKTAHALVNTGKKVFIREDLNLKSLSKRNKAKQDEKGNYLPNGQSTRSGLNKSWLDAAFGQFFEVLEYIAEKAHRPRRGFLGVRTEQEAGARIMAVKPAYTSQLLSYRDDFVFTDCDIREYWDDREWLYIDRDINAAINIKRVGLGLFPTIKRRKGNRVVKASTTNSTSKEVLDILRGCQKPTLYAQASV